MIILMINRDFELFQVLIAAAENRNFHEAARKLGLSQAAVSGKLKQLEAGCPLPVFTLQGKRKVLTRYGDELYRVAKSRLDACEKGVEAVNRRYLDARDLVLRVGCRNELFEAVSASLLFEGTVELKPMSSHEAVLALQSHEVDLAISYERPDLPDVLSKQVLTSSARLAVHSRWLKGKRLNLGWASDPDRLRHTPSLIYQANGHLLQEWVQHLGLGLSDLKVAAVAQDWRVIQTLIDDGHGYGITPSYVKYRSPEVQFVDLPNKVLPQFIFYGSFYKDLKGIPAFARVLARLASTSA